MHTRIKIQAQKIYLTSVSQTNQFKKFELTKKQSRIRYITPEETVVKNAV